MAIYNNGYPTAYSPMGYQQMTIPQYQMQQQAQQAQAPTMPQPTLNSTIVWVKQRKEAEDYLVAPNNSMVFMDEAMTHLYMKSADQFGRPSFTSKLLTDDTSETYVKPSESTEKIDMDKYLTREDFAKWVDDTLEKRLSELRPRQQRNKQTEKRDNNA